jgi:hypothetical protein
MKEVYVFRANDKVQVIPDALVNGEVKVASPSVPSSALALSGSINKIETIGVDSIGGIYIPNRLLIRAQKTNAPKRLSLLWGYF